jgi:hypothetical protein
LNLPQFFAGVAELRVFKFDFACGCPIRRTCGWGFSSYSAGMTFRCFCRNSGLRPRPSLILQSDMAVIESPRTPQDWSVRNNHDGGVDLCSPSRARGKIAAASAVLATFPFWKTIAHWHDALPHAAIPWLGLTVLLALFSLWCALADEVWVLRKNSLTRRIGIGPWARSSRFQDATLEIVSLTSTEFSVPYWRLYAVARGKKSFLMDRNKIDEIETFANFLSFYTGWPIRSTLPLP